MGNENWPTASADSLILTSDTGKFSIACKTGRFSCLVEGSNRFFTKFSGVDNLVCFKQILRWTHNLFKLYLKTRSGKWCQVHEKSLDLSTAISLHLIGPWMSQPPYCYNWIGTITWTCMMWNLVSPAILNDIVEMIISIYSSCRTYQLVKRNNRFLSLVRSVVNISQWPNT